MIRITDHTKVAFVIFIYIKSFKTNKQNAWAILKTKHNYEITSIIPNTFYRTLKAESMYMSNMVKTQQLSCLFPVLLVCLEQLPSSGRLTQARRP